MLSDRYSKGGFSDAGFIDRQHIRFIQNPRGTHFSADTDGALVRHCDKIRFRSVYAELPQTGGHMDPPEEILQRFDSLQGSFFIRVGRFHTHDIYCKTLEPGQAVFVYINQKKYELAEECIRKLPQKLNSSRLITPKTKKQEISLIESNAESFGDSFLRDDMDCIIDYVVAQKKGLEWTPERARYGLLKEERV